MGQSSECRWNIGEILVFIAHFTVFYCIWACFQLNYAAFTGKNITFCTKIVDSWWKIEHFLEKYKICWAISVKIEDPISLCEQQKEYFSQPFVKLFYTLQLVNFGKNRTFFWKIVDLFCTIYLGCTYGTLGQLYGSWAERYRLILLSCWLIVALSQPKVG